MVQVAQGHKQVQGGESGYKDTSWWKQAQADTNNPLSSSPPLRVQEYEYASSLTSLYLLMPLCLCACLCPCVYLHLLVPLCLHAPACTLVPTCTIVPTHTHSHPSYPVKLVYNTSTTLYPAHHSSKQAQVGTSKDMSRQKQTWADVLASLLPVSAKNSNKFDYSRQGLSVLTTSVPTTQPAFIESQSTIGRSLPPPKNLGQKPKPTNEVTLQVLATIFSI